MVKLISDPHGAGTIEHLHCTEGEIAVRSAGSETVVRGETARYAADVPHSLDQRWFRRRAAFLVVASGEVGSSTHPGIETFEIVPGRCGRENDLAKREWRYAGRYCRCGVRSPLERQHFLRNKGTA